MKWFAAFALVLFLLIATAGIILFTPPGNALIASIFQSQLRTELKLPVAVNDFVLTTSSFKLDLSLSEQNRIETSGNYSPFTQEIRARYRLRLNDLNAMKVLTQNPMYGILHTEGSIKGSFEKMIIKGVSDVAKSDTRYRVTLVNLEPSTANVELHYADMSTILAMAGKAAYLDGLLFIDAEMKNLNPHALQGSAILKITKGHIDHTLLQREFNVTIPASTFETDIDVELNGDLIDYRAVLNSNLAAITSSGTLTPQPLKADLVYNIGFEELALLQPLTGLALRGSLHTNGSVKGDEKQLRIEGSSDLAKSETRYNIMLSEMKPQQINATLRHGDLDKLFAMVSIPAFASGNLTLDAQLSDLDPDHLKGEARLSIDEGRVNANVLKREFNITVEPEPFTMAFDTRLNAETVAYRFELDAERAMVNSQGDIQPKTMGMNASFDADITELGLFAPLAGIPLQGKLKCAGTLIGNKELMEFKASSDIASSDTLLAVTLKEMQPHTISADIYALKLASLFHMLKMPHYADGSLDIALKINNAKMGELDGTVAIKLLNGIADSKVLSKTFEWGEMPKTTFAMRSDTVLHKSSAQTKTAFNSTLANITAPDMKSDLENAAFNGSYRIEIPDLDKLYFISDQHLKGAMRIDGEYAKSDHLELTAISHIADGTFQANIFDTELNATLSNMQTMQLLEILTYPQIFSSRLDAKLHYDTALSSGTMNATISNGKLQPSTTLDLIQTYLVRGNLYEESFNGTFDTLIVREKIRADLQLDSNHTRITSKNARLNTEKKMIDAKVDIVANKNPLSLTFKGGVNSPKVEIDAQKILEKEAEKMLQKGVKEYFKQLL